MHKSHLSRLLVTTFLVHLLCAGIAQHVCAQDASTIVVNSDLVNLTVTVADKKGRLITDLDKDAFSIYENSQKQTIHFFSREDAPISVGIIFDVSGSMSPRRIEHARLALQRFIETSSNQDEYFLVAFNQRAELLADRTRDADALLNQLRSVQPKGQTALYDACYLGLEKVMRGTHRKRALLLFTDGEDNRSRYKLSELMNLVKESDVSIYAIGMIEDMNLFSQEMLTDLTALTGGKAFFPDSDEELPEVFEKIALELRSQYAIAYRPENSTADGKLRRVKVKLELPKGGPKLIVRSREGYYPSSKITLK